MYKKLIYKLTAQLVSLNLFTQALLIPMAMAQELVDPTPEPNEATASASINDVSPSPDPTPEPEATHSAEVVNTASISATTGNNEASGSGTATVYTGDAAAIANVVNTINTKATDSQLAFIALTPPVNESGDVDLNELWQQIAAINEALVNNSSDAYPLKLTLFNSADINTIVFVNADSGANTLTSDAVNLTTGQTLAIANVGQLINADLFNAKVLFSIINILPGFTGNIILPRPPLAGSVDSAGVLTAANNSASTSASITANANTGNNSSTGEASTTTITGDATSLASAVEYIDTLIFNSMLYSFIVNNLSGAPVLVEGWQLPIVNNILEFFNPLPAIGDNISPTESVNDATVATTITSIANTGLNNLTGTATSVKTGTAKAAATLLEFTNLTIRNGRLFTGIANIASDWFGKIIIAHPDLAITATPVFSEAAPGSEVSFSLTMANIGHDLAQNPQATFTLPPQVNFESTSCNYPQTMVGRSITWQLPTMPKNAQLTCSVSGKVAADFSFNTATSFSFIKQAFAADHTWTQDISATATIETTDPELNLKNNTSSGQLTVVKSETESDSNSSTMPDLAISAAHNVNDFVYAGDTVTFFIKVTNSGHGPAKDTTLTQTLYDQNGQAIGSATFNLGTIESHRGGKLTFGITLPQSSVTGTYTTSARAYANSDNGASVTSNVSGTSFQLLGLHRSARTGIVTAASNDPGTPQILGTTTVPLCQLPFNPIPYVVIVIMSAIWFGWTKSKWPQNRLPKILFAGTSAAMFTATLYATYVIGNHYNFLPALPWLDRFLLALHSRFLTV